MEVTPLSPSAIGTLFFVRFLPILLLSACFFFLFCFVPPHYFFLPSFRGFYSLILLALFPALHFFFQNFGDFVASFEFEMCPTPSFASSPLKL